ncbi:MULTISPECIES: hypothetical protein [Streptomyces]|uniref:Uncharacterized protein n=1 Tax=Streptomyces tsukubensis (strain DSM 42081 / NBRC 108919 / NRRL 18488 / 9993) TaxID=1114943 RepID=I2MUV4_STRT9|nr:MULTISPECIES: hypothetical protein [Streptomyces]AZK93052.1 hypothetical protein B7R87_03535 [Streptomyces tsukubensis]EIF88551.1 hypothetical protein [Streptomyces tsukubensis NRRL18488]MYS67056.1 hypothetical protein [Streptomyces sp. SID5473]QKM70783.1 hypothetical protein STSU_030290 [Streptomyces tsukubensis NRRL18488]TAI41099.1 hypothetical protein EWI31_29555 [Streptomyces tsukubensis]
MQLTPEELVAEFHDAVMELYFARKRIAHLEAENEMLRVRPAEAGPGSTEQTGAAAETVP